MIETLPQWAQIGFWGIMIIFSYFFTYTVGHNKARDTWRTWLEKDREHYKKKAIKDADTIALLTDGLGGTCPRCKGFGVLGKDGSSECLVCGGTGVRDLSVLREQNEVIISKAISDCDATKKRLQSLLTNN